MEIYLVLAFIFGIFCLITLFMPWKHQLDINHLYDKINFLEDKIKSLSSKPAVQPETYKDEKQLDIIVTAEQPIVERSEVGTRTQSEHNKSWLENLMGAKLAVWIGAIALGFSIIYLVRYSIEKGILTPQLRLILGGIFGLVLIATGQIIRRRAQIEQSYRIAQALSGAGLSILYIILYVATNIYGFIPNSIAFTGMVAVTLSGVVLSLFQGAPIAFLSLSFGFLTPALVSDHNPSTALLFGYLFILYLGSLILSARQAWWNVAIFSTAAVFIWTALWLGTGFVSADGLYISLFLVAVIGALVILTQAQPVDYQTDNFVIKAASYLRLAGVAIGLLLFISVLNLSHYGLIELGLYASLLAGLAVLTYIEEEKYKELLITGCLFFAAILWVWQPANLFLLSVILISGVGMAIVGLILMYHGVRTNLWAIFSATTIFIHYLIAYVIFKHAYALGLASSNLWSVIGFGLSLISIAIALFARPLANKIPTAIFLFAATGFLSFALGIELSTSYWPIVVSLEMLAASLLWPALKVPGLNWLLRVLIVALGGSLLTFVPFLADLLLSSLSGDYKVYFYDYNLPRLSLQFGVPALALAGAVYNLRTTTLTVFKALTGFAGLLSIYALYFIARAIVDINSDGNFSAPTFITRGSITLVFAILGCAVTIYGTIIKNSIIKYCGQSVILISALRVIGFDILVSNPLFLPHQVGNLPIFNGLLLVYLLPAVLYWLTAYYYLDDIWKKTSGIGLLIGIFIFLSLSVRHLFQGMLLYSGVFTNPEIYTYSAIWLIYGVGLLAIGIITRTRPLRYASLVFIMLTVGKVFLYDASELTGLYRVFSFMGLGISLIGLSYFYSQFVLKQGQGLITSRPG